MHVPLGAELICWKPLGPAMRPRAILGQRLGVAGIAISLFVGHQHCRRSGEAQAQVLDVSLPPRQKLHCWSRDAMGSPPLPLLVCVSVEPPGQDGSAMLGLLLGGATVLRLKVLSAVCVPCCLGGASRAWGA